MHKKRAKHSSPVPGKTLQYLCSTLKGFHHVSSPRTNVLAEGESAQHAIKVKDLFLLPQLWLTHFTKSTNNLRYFRYGSLPSQWDLIPYRWKRKPKKALNNWSDIIQNIASGWRYFYAHWRKGCITELDQMPLPAETFHSYLLPWGLHYIALHWAHL